MFIRFTIDHYVGDKRYEAGQSADLDKTICDRLIAQGVAAANATDSNPAYLNIDPLTGGATGLQEPSGKQLLASNFTKNFVGTRVLTGGAQGGSYATSGQDFTWSLQVALPVDFVALRLVIGNPLTSAITGVTCAASTGGTLTDRTNNAGAWTSGTFSGASSITLPAGVTGNPSVTLSDWIPVQSVARLDGGSTRLAYVRILTPLANANIGLFGYAASTANWNSKADGYAWCPRFQAGDFVTTPSGMTASTDPSSLPIMGIQYISKTGVLNYVAFGDSITNSAQTTVRGESWAYRAVRDAGYTLGAFGWDGQTTAQILTRAQVTIPLLKPTHAFYPIFSPNDGTPTAATQTAQFSRALQFVELCRVNNCVPILWTGLPKTTDGTNTTSAWTAGQDDLRKALNSAFTSIGVEVVDMSGVLSDNAAMGTASKWLNTSILFDGTHPNDAGHELMKGAAAVSVAKF